MSVFAERLKELRKDKGLTQKELGEDLGMTQSNYQKWEGEKSSPSGDTLVRFANYFNVSIDYLVGRKNQRK